MAFTQLLIKNCLSIALLLIASVCLAQDTTTAIERSIKRIENNIVRIDQSGVSKGEPQALLIRMGQLKVPGVSIAIFDQGHILWAKGYGLGDKRLAYAVDTATIFQAASISKPLASVALLALAEKNQVQLDEDINVQLNSWKVPDNEYTTTEKVTPKRMISHTAGLSVHGFRGYSQQAVLPGLLDILNGTVPANSKPVQVVHQPGSKEMYSGGGFVVLQLLLQEKMGKPFAALMDSLVIRPAGMWHSTFALSLPDSMLPYVAKGYLSNGRMVTGGYNVYPEQAAAGLWTTPSDLARFMMNVGNSYRGGQGILQQGTVQMMFTKVPNGNGLGFGIDGEGDELRFAHYGGNVGYTCYAVAFANLGRGIVVMTNSDNGMPLIKEIVRAVYQEYGWVGQ